MNKGSTGTDSDAKVAMEIKFHLISTDIDAKLGTVAIGIRMGITIGIGVGSVETVLHIIIESNFIGISVGIGFGQWKHTIISIAALGFGLDHRFLYYADTIGKGSETESESMETCSA